MNKLDKIDLGTISHLSFRSVSASQQNDASGSGINKQAYKLFLTPSFHCALPNKPTDQSPSFVIAISAMASHDTQLGERGTSPPHIRARRHEYRAQSSQPSTIRNPPPQKKNTTACATLRAKNMQKRSRVSIEYVLHNKTTFSQPIQPKPNPAQDPTCPKPTLYPINKLT